MPYYVTAIQAIDPKTGLLVNWYGPFIHARNDHLAQNICDKNGLGFCTIIGELVAEVEAEGEGMVIWAGERIIHAP